MWCSSFIGCLACQMHLFVLTFNVSLRKFNSDDHYISDYTLTSVKVFIQLLVLLHFLTK